MRLWRQGRPIPDARHLLHRHKQRRQPVRDLVQLLVVLRQQLGPVAIEPRQRVLGTGRKAPGVRVHHVLHVRLLQRHQMTQQLTALLDILQLKRRRRRREEYVYVAAMLVLVGQLVVALA